MPIWVTQWLCPQRHCSIAYVWDDQEKTQEEIEATGERLYSDSVFRRHCGICGGGLHVEHGATKFKTIEEAQPEVERLQELNLQTRRIIGGRY